MASGISRSALSSLIKNTPSSNLKIKGSYIQVKAGALPQKSAKQAHSANKIDKMA